MPSLHPSSAIVGLLLAGGRSRRFGSEKAVAAWGDGRLMDTALAALAPHCAGIAVSAPLHSAAADAARAQKLTLLPDPPDAPDGPLSGLREGLRWAARCGASCLAVLPCDLPFIRPAVVGELLARLAMQPELGAAAAEDDGGLHALCSAWRTAALPAVEAALRGGAHPPVRAVLEAAAYAAVRFEAHLLTNANRPQDLKSPPPALGG